MREMKIYSAEERSSKKKMGKTLKTKVVRVPHAKMPKYIISISVLLCVCVASVCRVTTDFSGSRYD